MTNKVYEFKDRKIKEYLGDIDYYLDQRKVADFRAIEKKQEIQKVKNDTGKGQNNFKDQKKLKSIKNKLSSLEKKIADLKITFQK